MAMKSSAGAKSHMAAWKAFGSVVEPDLLLTQKMVRADSRPLLEAAHRIGVGGVEDAQLESVARRAAGAEGAAEDLRRQAGAAHAQHRRAGIAVVAHVARQVLELADPRPHGLRQVKPAEPAAQRLRGRPGFGPQAAVLGPQPIGDSLLLPGGEALGDGRVRAGHRSCRCERLALAVDDGDQVVEGLAEGGHALVDQLVGDLLHADPLLLDQLQGAMRAGHVLVQRPFQLAVVEEGRRWSRSAWC